MQGAATTYAQHDRCTPCRPLHRRLLLGPRHPPHQYACLELVASSLLSHFATKRISCLTSRAGSLAPAHASVLAAGEPAACSRAQRAVQRTDKCCLLAAPSGSCGITASRPSGVTIPTGEPAACIQLCQLPSKARAISCPGWLTDIWVLGCSRRESVPHLLTSLPLL